MKNTLRKQQPCWLADMPAQKHNTPNLIDTTLLFEAQNLISNLKFPLESFVACFELHLELLLLGLDKGLVEHQGKLA